MEENAKLKEKVQNLEKQVHQLRSEKDELDERFQETKKTLRETEQNCNKLYREIGTSNQAHVDKIEESQKKFEEASLMITKQSVLVDDLNTQLEQLKEVNSQLEYSWGQKYREMAEMKDQQYDKLQNEVNQKVSELKKK